MENNISLKNLKPEDFEQEAIFSEETYKFLKEQGLSEQEISDLEDAESLANAAEILPEEPSEVLDKIANIPTESVEKANEYLINIVKNDTQGFVQMMAAASVINEVSEEDAE